MCTDTPRPRVMTPTSESPGIGLQHLAKRMSTSSSPCTKMPLLDFLPRLNRLLILADQRSKVSGSSSEVTGGAKTSRILVVLILPTPSATIISSPSLNPRASAVLFTSPVRQTRCKLIPRRLHSFSRISWPISSERLRCSARTTLRILLRALAVLTNDSQSLLGRWLGLVMISTVSPFLSFWRSGAILPLMRAPTQ